MSIKEFTQSEDHMVFYAFRYCLGRQTYAVSHCAEYLVLHWDRVSANSKDLIVKEINEAIESGRAGAACDIDSWLQVLDRATE